MNRVERRSTAINEAVEIKSGGEGAVRRSPQIEVGIPDNNPLAIGPGVITWRPARCHVGVR